MPEERRLATGAAVDALVVVLVVFASAGPFGALLSQHSKLARRGRGREED